MKFVLFVEGQTETRLRRGLFETLAGPATEPAGRNPAGAFHGYAEWVRKLAIKARMHLEGPKRGEIIAVIGLSTCMVPVLSGPPHDSLRSVTTGASLTFRGK